MTFIEGIGDEVTAFFVVVIVIILATLVTFIGSGPHVYTPVHTRSVQFSLISGRELAEASVIQSPDPPDSSTPRNSRSQRPPPGPDNNQSPPSNDRQPNQDQPTPQNDQVSDQQTQNSNPNLQTQSNQEESTQQQQSSNEQEESVQQQDSGNSEQSPMQQDSGNSPNSEQSSVQQDSGIAASDMDSVSKGVNAPDAAANQPTDGIRVRLKYLDDTERTVRSSPVTRVGDFKRCHFSDDLASNKVVRLIFCGHLLRDAATLASYRVVDNSVLHVQVLAQSRNHAPGGTRTDGQPNTPPDMLDLSHLLYPLVILILGLCWAAYLKYPEFFSLISVSLLFVFTFSFFAFYRHVHN